MSRRDTTILTEVDFKGNENRIAYEINTHKYFCSEHVFGIPVNLFVHHYFVQHWNHQKEGALGCCSFFNVTFKE